MVAATEIRSWVERFDPQGDDRAMRSRRATLDLLAVGDGVCARTWFDPGHVTASGLVLSADAGAVLLVFHGRLGRWLQPGGHVEASDATIVDVARREILEETGVSPDDRIEPALVSVDVHEIPAARGERAHRHHDLMFRFVACDASPGPLARALRAVWAPVDRLGEFGVDEPLCRAVDRARAMPRGASAAGASRAKPARGV